MQPGRIAHVAELGRLTLDGDVEITGSDPALATPWPVGEIAAVALARSGVAAARLARRAGGAPGSVRTDVGTAAAATIGFAVMRVDGESMARTNAENPWVGRYRCADGRWIHLHGGFPALAERLASLLDVPVGADEAMIAAAVGTWDVGLVGGRDREPARLLGDHPHRGRMARTRAGPTRAQLADRRGRHPWRGCVDEMGAVDDPAARRAPCARPHSCARRPNLRAHARSVRRRRAPRARTQRPGGPRVRRRHRPRQAAGARRLCRCGFVGCAPSGRARSRRGRAGLPSGRRCSVWPRRGVVAPDGFDGVFASVSAFGHDGPWADRAGWEQLAQATSGLCLDPLGDDKPGDASLRRDRLHHRFRDGCGDHGGARCIARRWGRSPCRRLAVSDGGVGPAHGRLGEVASPSGFSPDLQRSVTGFGIVDHLGPCVEIDGLDVGWTRPTTPLGEGRLSW